MYKALEILSCRSENKRKCEQTASRVNKNSSGTRKTNRAATYVKKRRMGKEVSAMFMPGKLNKTITLRLNTTNARPPDIKKEQPNGENKDSGSNSDNK